MNAVAQIGKLSIRASRMAAALCWPSTMRPGFPFGSSPLIERDDERSPAAERRRTAASAGTNFTCGQMPEQSHLEGEDLWIRYSSGSRKCAKTPLAVDNRPPSRRHLAECVRQWQTWRAVCHPPQSYKRSCCALAQSPRRVTSIHSDSVISENPWNCFHSRNALKSCSRCPCSCWLNTKML